MTGRFRRWQANHDAKLTERYDRLPQPLRAVAKAIYPSQQRQKRRAKQQSPGLLARDIVTPPPPQDRPSVADELLRLAELRDQGTLTEAEFQLAKERLLEGQQ